jgi:putative hemolysin
MDLPYLELSILIALTAVNAFFTGSEIAFVSLREGQLQRLEETERGRRVVHLARNSTRFLASCQIGITLAGFFASATAAVSLSGALEDQLDFFGSAAGTVSVVLVTLILAYFTLVLGELAPKRIAMQRAERWAVFAAPILGFVAQLSRPFIWVLERSTNLVVRLFGGDPALQREEVTGEEIRDLVESQETFSEDQRSIIAGAFEVADRTLREIVVPRGSVIAVPTTATAREGVEVMAQAGHSRSPVHSGDLDDVIGIVHIRDLIHYDGVVSEQTRPATVLPESLGVLDALRRMQQTHQQMAIVVNEHGGVEGIVTVEDLLEEIVGEIYDEFDREIANVEEAENGCLILAGSFPIHDLADVKASLPDGEGAYATVAGYVLDRLGHIPTIGEIVPGEEWDVEVLEVDERAITKVKLIPVAPSEESNSDD